MKSNLQNPWRGVLISHALKREEMKKKYKILGEAKVRAHSHASN
jgi:hypothetical protein